MLGIASITFLKNHRCFKLGETIKFREGLNLLVGDQGTGKSTVLEIARQSRDHKSTATVEIPSYVQIGGFDFEKSNPRVQAALGGNDGKMPIDFQVAAMWASHGEVNNILLKSLASAMNCVMVLDEPDQALSIRSIWTLCKTLDMAVKNNVQFIASAHSPILIMHAKEVYSLEHREWMTGSDFIQSQKSPRSDLEPPPEPKKKPKKKKS